jgi:hypothetical protein
MVQVTNLLYGRNLLLTRFAVAIAFLPLWLFVADAAFAEDPAADESGRLCLAALPTPTSGEGSLSSPTGGMTARNYSVRIDGRPTISLSNDRTTWIDALPISSRHLVEILNDGKRVESFYFRFDKTQSHELCLFLKPLYETWILWPVESSGPWCACSTVPAV